MDRMLDYLQKNKNNILSDLEKLVRAESPSDDKKHVDRCGAVLRELFQKHLNIEAEVISQEKAGNDLRFTYGEGESQILILAHFDTVWDVGRLSFHVEDGKAYGPGILDMKGGIIQSLWALKACRVLNLPLNKKIVFLCTSDEEVGSTASRELIEQEALKSEAVLVPEPAVAKSGALKTSRKGVGQFKIIIKGKASHAGNHPEDGISAVEEMAHQILYLHSLNDYEKGTTINAGITHGGSRVNVVAERAEIDVDARVSSMQEGERISHLIHDIKPHLKGTTVKVLGDIERPPMVKTKKTEQLFQIAQSCAKELGIQLKEEKVGGGSDGNFTSALGIPTLDGLGSVGEGPHAEYEHILIDQLPVRSALMAKLLVNL
ncbi:M20 family metallopeptidase [Scopulibacillus cellulosilyticus]|uniref:M20 family metallopeptidase n=1 Tax=Scopulibacillus cellulosilyticus TaxID=2665665 RepID=A0ABW2PSG5_9BACL